jgi:hypothetical protein
MRTEAASLTDSDFNWVSQLSKDFKTHNTDTSTAGNHRAATNGGRDEQNDEGIVWNVIINNTIRIVTLIDYKTA